MGVGNGKRIVWRVRVDAFLERTENELASGEYQPFVESRFQNKVVEVYFFSSWADMKQYIEAGGPNHVDYGVVGSSRPATTSNIMPPPKVDSMLS